jgi:DNA (cytosine-5)-methyltransferase 1
VTENSRKKLTVGSLFAGIGGIELGLESTGGFETRWQVECDPYAQKVLAKHWPDCGRWDDVRTFPPSPVEDWRIDVMCGGFPCQDISVAGRRRGLRGERSGLFFEAIRVARLLKPSFIILENVARLLVGSMGTILAELAESGYHAEWECLPACAFGADHQRDRVFVLAYPVREQRSFFRPCETTDESGKLWKTINPWCKERHKWLGQSKRLRADSLRRSVAAGVCGMADGVPAQLERLACLGNSVVPQVATWVGERILSEVGTDE